MAITFRFHYPIERTMAFEREYHPNLRLSLPEKRELLKSAITIWMLEDGKLVGETYGVPWSGKDDMMGFPRDPEAIYCYSNTILRQVPGQRLWRHFEGGVYRPRVARFQTDLRTCSARSQPGAEQEIRRSHGQDLQELVRHGRGLPDVCPAAGEVAQGLERHTWGVGASHTRSGSENKRVPGLPSAEMPNAL